MSTRRVLLISNHAEIIGGGEISLLTLATGLRDTSWSPIVAVPGPGELAARCSGLGIDVVEVPLPAIRPSAHSIGAVRRMRRVITDTGVELVHANGARAMFYAGLALFFSATPLIWHLRILDPDPRSDPMSARFATATLAISSAVRERLKRWPKAYEACTVVPNGLDLESFQATRTRRENRALLGLSDDDFAVGCVSRLVDFKRHDLLIEAIAVVAASTPAVKCVLVGTGPEEEALRAKVLSAGLSKQVLFAGHRDDVADVLSAFDIFVLPSPAEHFGRVVIEAMAAGLPVVATDAAGPSEIIVPEESGILVQPGESAAIADAISRLYDCPETRQRLGLRARERVTRRYTMEAHTTAVVSVYDQLSAPAHGSAK